MSDTPDERVTPTYRFQVSPVGCQVNDATVTWNNDTVTGPCGFYYGSEASQWPAFCDLCLSQTERLNDLLGRFTLDNLERGIDLLLASFLGNVAEALGIEDSEDGQATEEPHRHHTVFTPEQQIRNMVEVVAEAESRLEQMGLPVMALRLWLADSLDLRDLRTAHLHGHLEPIIVYDDGEVE